MKPLAAWVFTHDHPLGNYPLHKLHELIKLAREGGAGSEDAPARAYTDYEVSLAWEQADSSWSLKEDRLAKNDKELGVTVTELYNDWRD